VRAHVIDVREEFARDFILPALQAGAIYDGRHPLATALGRPMIAKKLIEMANIEGASAVAHGCTGDDEERMDASARALDPSIAVIAAAGQWDATRPEKIKFARQRGIPVPPTRVFDRVKSPAEPPDMPAHVDLEFERGVPVRINDVEMSLIELISSLETIAGAHGVGVDNVEHRLAALQAAHQELQTFVTNRQVEQLTSELSLKYADLINNGLWYTSTREAMDALVHKVQEKVTGSVRLKFFKGDCRVVGRKSPNALHDHDMATAHR
jgi:argininosuccinate synthase